MSTEFLSQTKRGMSLSVRPLAELFGLLPALMAAVGLQDLVAEAEGFLCCSTTYRFLNDSFHPNLPFVFCEIEGMIGEGFPNGSG